ncbi:MAG TPA: hypothetical protein VGF81_04445 [Solirubrobacteraceae bacterium]
MDAGVVVCCELPLEPLGVVVPLGWVVVGVLLGCVVVPLWPDPELTFRGAGDGSVGAVVGGATGIRIGGVLGTIGAEAGGLAVSPGPRGSGGATVLAPGLDWWVSGAATAPTAGPTSGPPCRDADDPEPDAPEPGVAGSSPAPAAWTAGGALAPGSPGSPGLPGSEPRPAPTPLPAAPIATSASSPARGAPNAPVALPIGPSRGAPATAG